MIIETEIEIAAPPMKVWRALCDFESYSKWNPYHDVLGNALLGEKVTMMIGRNPKARRKLAATISALEPGKLLSFSSGRTVFARATESFTLEPSPKGTRLRHIADMRGVGIRLMPLDWITPRLLGVYQAGDRALERYVTRGKVLKESSRPRRQRRR